MIILYLRLPYFHVSNSALVFTYYSDNLLYIDVILAPTNEIALMWMSFDFLDDTVLSPSLTLSLSIYIYVCVCVYTVTWSQWQMIVGFMSQWAI